MSEPANSTDQQRIHARALREIQPPTEIFDDDVSLINSTKKKKLWKEDLDELLENCRSFLGKSRVEICSRGKRFEASSSEKGRSAPTDKERKWEEDLKEELAVQRLFRRRNREEQSLNKVAVIQSKSETAESSSEEQRRKWKEELEEELRVKREMALCQRKL